MKQGNSFAYRTSYSLIHYQYNRKPTLSNISDRLVSGVPSEFLARYCVFHRFIFVLGNSHGHFHFLQWAYSVLSFYTPQSSDLITSITV